MSLVISTAYLEVKIWSLFKHENLIRSNKILCKRGEIAPKEQYLLFSTLFSLNFYFICIHITLPFTTRYDKTSIHTNWIQKKVIWFFLICISHYFEYISNFMSQITYSFVKCDCSIDFFPQFCKNLICQGLFVFVLRFYGLFNPMGSCWAQSVYLPTRLLGRLSPLSG